jgi:hypothetical protein
MLSYFQESKIKLKSLGHSANVLAPADNVIH